MKYKIKIPIYIDYKKIFTAPDKKCLKFNCFQKDVSPVYEVLETLATQSYTNLYKHFSCAWVER